LVELPERQLYRNVIGVTRYHSRGLRLIDYEDTDIVVNEQFDKFAEIYRPYLTETEPFKSTIKIMDSQTGTPIPLNAPFQGAVKFVSSSFNNLSIRMILLNLNVNSCTI
jgi:hypothetical protein